MSLNAPTISLANDETGTSFTATVAGPEGSDIRLLYRRSDSASWVDGGTANAVTAGGVYTIQAVGLSYGFFQAVAVSELGDERSVPSSTHFVRVYDPDAETEPNRGPLRAMARLRTTLAACPAWQSWTQSASALEAAARVHLFGVDPPMPWQAEAELDIGRMTAPYHDGTVSNGGGVLMFEVTSAGTTGAERPMWSAADEAGGTVEDGSVTWTARAVPAGSTPENLGITLSRPFAVVVRPESYTAVAREGEGSLSGTQLRVYIEADIPEAHQASVESAGTWFYRLGSEIQADLLERAGFPGYLDAQMIVMRDMRRATQEEQAGRGHFAYMILEVQL